MMNTQMMTVAPVLLQWKSQILAKKRTIEVNSPHKYIFKKITQERIYKNYRKHFRPQISSNFLHYKLLEFAEWTDNDLVAQAIIFLLAGFDTVSTAMTFIIHELALNPEVQQKLVEEIKEYDQKNGGKLDFTSIQSMKYMDMVVSGEWSTQRICNQY